jgi:hypothetical protein
VKRTPLRAKRLTPRRNEGRVAHERIKPKEPKEPTYLGFIASLGCLVCGCPATVHHVTSDGYKRLARSDRRVAPLCCRHHQIQHGPRESVEALGHAGFKARYGIDLLKWADDAWACHDAPEHGFWSVGVTRMRAIASAGLREHKSERGAPKDEQRRSTRSNPTPTVGGIEL